MKTWCFLIALLSGVTADAQSTLTYERPEKATKQDATKDAEALNKRCLSAGLRGLKVTAVANGETFRLEVTSKASPSEVDLKKLDLFARIKCQRVELRAGRSLTDDERKAGFGQEKPPDGFRYYRWIDDDFAPNKEGSAFLASDAPGIPWSEVSAPKKSDSRLDFELTDSGTKKVYTVKGWTADAFKSDAKLTLIFDDLCIKENVSVVLYDGPSKLKRGRFSWSVDFGTKAEAMFRNPMQHVWTRKAEERK